MCLFLGAIERSPPVKPTYTIHRYIRYNYPSNNYGNPSHNGNPNIMGVWPSGHVGIMQLLTMAHIEREKSPSDFLWHMKHVHDILRACAGSQLLFLPCSSACSANPGPWVHAGVFRGVQPMGLTESGRILLGKNKHTSYSSQTKWNNLLRCHKVINPTFMDYAHIHPREPAVLYRVSPTWKGLRTSKKKRAMGINRYSWIDDHSPIWASCPSFWPWRVSMHWESWKLFGQQKIGQKTM